MLVFSPKRRQPILEQPGRERLCRYARGFFRNKGGELFVANGVEDHLHFVFFLPPTICAADLVRDLKRSLHNFSDAHRLFPLFGRWQERYSWFTYSRWDRDMICDYVRRQEAHHADQRETYLQELRRLYDLHGLEWDEKYLE